MPVPVSIEKILNPNIVEDERIEFKGGWNPEPILHAICAFTNDIRNLGGGYIIVGMEDRGTVIGADQSTDFMNRELLKLTKKVEPECDVESQPFEIDGKRLFVVWVPSGKDKPYDCPRSLSEKCRERCVYVRRLASTTMATQSEIRELITMASDVPFDDRPNRKAVESDIDPALLEGYLRKVDSKLLPSGKMDINGILERMHMTDRMYEETCYRNVALLFFCREPDRFFEGAYIEATYRPDPTGKDMVEKRCSGPLDSQIVQAVEFVRKYAIEQRTIKHRDTPVADRPYSYPPECVEEAITNAVLHKDYSMRRPISLIIDYDRITIRSHPGPYRDITDEDLRNGIMISDNVRNARVGNILKELGLAEARNTGIPLIHQSMINNGSDKVRLETDEDRTFFKIIIPIHKSFLKDVPDVRSNNTPGELRASIIALLVEGDMSVREISDRLGYKRPPSNLRAEIQVLISNRTIRYTDGSLNSPKQKLHLIN